MSVQLKSIICATDFSDFSNHAVSYAIAFAQEFGAKLYMCHVIDLSYAATYGRRPDPQEVEDQIINYASERLEGSIGGKPINWEPLISKGRASDEIARMAEEIGVDLAISATYGRSGFKRLVLGSVTERLVRTLCCPLLVVHSPEPGFDGTSEQKVKLDRILVGCDFSPDSDLSFQYALSLAQQFGCELHLAHVLETTVYRDLLKPPKTSRKDQQHPLCKELDEKLTEMVPEEAHSCCSPNTTLLAGQPYDELTKYALTHDIDLIVLGVRGHGLMETMFLGSTTDRVLRQAPCPVLSIRPTCPSPWDRSGVMN
jgi:nucleotide-binding universal stress UspA family protein